ncbi:ribonuclease H-like domain-containing protein [Rhodocollybia butyracea]|uniref:Ribonuclease H-like domain-containing protein n=1 Tax=Rhodocollybia butyracea TaxID=206335 RepID=A0A9P5U7B2_9AGAR|nr:ribonuclease H-like domain-containing protein [Rhodocollybia butyracea]
MSSQESSILTSSFDEFSSQLQSSALKATRNSMLLPSDLHFHRTMDPEFSKDLDLFSSRILSVANKLLTLVGTAESSSKSKGKLESEDDVVDNFHSVVVDVMDRMMEKTDINLDEFLGRNKAPAIAINTKLIAAKKKSSASNTKAKGGLDPALQHASHLPKPQLKFAKKIENNNVPWVPTLSHKYNASVPLGYNYHDSDSQMEMDTLLGCHPYRYEITHISYPPRMFEPSTPIPPTPFDATTFRWVSTVSELESMLVELRKVTEFAVDLEHHSYRSYAGFLCLMQVSTRQQDWIVDLLVLRDEVSILNEVFTNPKITKVFHGAESDVVWLQQDLEIYIVNLFDTFHASKVLGFPRHGLANLLEMYCDFTADKRYQLADWRIRPLPEEMLDYARSDTHFLLYIYDNLRNALLDRASSQGQDLMERDDSNSLAPISQPYPPTQTLVQEVLSKSEETALRFYEKEYYDVERGTGGNGWDTLARKWNKINLYASSSTIGIPGMQRDIYRRIHLWRDKVAREEDESTRYVLPNHYIFQLAEQPPADMAAMLRIFHFVPPVLKRRAKELLDVIREALKHHLTAADEKSLDVPMLQESAKAEQQLSLERGSIDPSLWPSGSLSTKPPLSSSLFGDMSLNSIRSHNRDNILGMAAPQSTLFGNTLANPQPVSNRNVGMAPLDHFTEVVARIHSNLVIAPSAAKVIHTTNASSVEQSFSAEVVEDGILPSSAQVEIPFVPAAQRSIKTSVSSTPDDAIVIVGQSKQKKRKRAKDPANSGEKRENQEANAAPFDFASAPNILDAVPAPEQSHIPRKKPKQSKGSNGSAFYGSFPAPPKAHSEVKSGNKSHTFK